MKRKINLTQKNAVGMAIGFLFPVICLPLTILLISWSQNFYYSMLWSKTFSDMGVLSKFLSLSIIPNLLWFYFFLNRERYEIAKGVIIGSGLFLPFIIYVNLLR